MWSVARRPRWIALLVLALAIASAFAALGQWQFAQSVASEGDAEQASENVRPLAEVAQPQTGFRDDVDGQQVSVDGEFVESDFLVLDNRVNDGELGYWVVGHLVTDGSESSRASVSVALGWAATLDDAEAVVRSAPSAGTVVGRYLPGEGPQDGDLTSGLTSTMAPSAFVNLWDVAAGGTYSGYVVTFDPPAGLEAIDAPPPSSDVQINWLNVFYAAEWVIFAGFAVFMWYRLVRDAHEREQELAAEEEADLDVAPSAQRAPVN
ncbi:SURF1 family protein [Marisediminicola sp. LYQ134]|uniref:SURF1 family protein n=1 Tax=Marisediminicola sp. LYQ134 TaxID=3391061 RepID=UPI003983659A